ncbi:MAG: DNA adenine methylase [Meiothermus ruber]|nr:DNA adenine methylase [Meiothermus ruber]
MIKYIGSKRALLPWITGTIQSIHHQVPIRTVVDLFSGSARVGHALKARGFYVISNDLMSYAHVLAQALVEADARTYSQERVQPILDRLQSLPPRQGWFTQDYCEKARYFQPKNGARIEAIREGLEAEAGGDPLLRAILLTSLMLAADRVDSTTGVQMAYLKRWAPRAHNDLRLDYPPVLSGPGQALQGDALEVAAHLEADLFYLDPPYNQHSYLGNYHVWETLVRWDKPQTYGVANKRKDVQERKSPFNSKREAREAMQTLLGRIQAQHLVVSFNNEGFFAAEEIEEMLRHWGFVRRLTRPHARYVGARIGIYNPQGEKVGQVSHTENHEYLFVATHSRRVYNALSDHAEPAAALQLSLF